MRVLVADAHRAAPTGRSPRRAAGAARPAPPAPRAPGWIVCGKSGRTAPGWPCRRARPAPRAPRPGSRAGRRAPRRPPAAASGGEPVGEVGRAGRRRRAAGRPTVGGVELRPQLAEQRRRTTSAPDSTTRCSTRPVLVISTSSSRVGVSGTSSTCRTLDRDSEGYCTTATCRVSCASSRTVRADDVVEVDAPSRKVWIARRSAVGQRLDRGEPVDEQPVALVGGDAPGAGVRLGDVALVLQRRHVVADRRRRDAEVVPLDERLGADRLLGGDVVLDDGAQHFELAVLEHAPPPVVGRRRRPQAGTPDSRVPSVRRPPLPGAACSGASAGAAGPRPAGSSRDGPLPRRRARRRGRRPGARAVPTRRGRARPGRRGRRDRLLRRRGALREDRRRAHGDPRGPARPAPGVPARARASWSTAPPVELVRPAAAGARRRPAYRVGVGRRRRRARPGRPRRAGSTSRASTTPSWSRRSGATTCGSRASSSSTSAASTTCPPWSATSGRRPSRRLGVLVDHLVPGQQGVAARRAGRLAARAGRRPPVRRRVAGGAAGRAGHRRLARGAARHAVEGGRLRRAGLAGRPARGLAADPRRGADYADLEPSLLGRVEELIDFVTGADRGRPRGLAMTTPPEPPETRPTATPPPPAPPSDPTPPPPRPPPPRSPAARSGTARRRRRAGAATPARQQAGRVARRMLGRIARARLGHPRSAFDRRRSRGHRLTSRPTSRPVSTDGPPGSSRWTSGSPLLIATCASRRSDIGRPAADASPRHTDRSVAARRGRHRLLPRPPLDPA